MRGPNEPNWRQAKKAKEAKLAKEKEKKKDKQKKAARKTAMVNAVVKELNKAYKEWEEVHNIEMEKARARWFEYGWQGCAHGDGYVRAWELLNFTPVRSGALDGSQSLLP